MREKYHHLNQEERTQIFECHQRGVSQGAIAKQLGRSKSTICREITRNRYPVRSLYLPDTAEHLSRERRNRPGSKLGRSKRLQKLIEKHLIKGWSPEVIAGRLKLENAQETISHESIYKWIYGEGIQLNWRGYLIRKKRKRGRRPCRKVDKIKIPARVSIHKRPQSYQKQSGHWEGDTIHFAGHKGAIATLYEKKTKMLLAAKMETRTTQETIGNMGHMLRWFPASFRRSITFDNGLEFTGHQKLNRELKVKTFFCDPYASWQKGGVENANGILRRYVPKGSKADEYSSNEIADYVRQINMTPRKSLAYKTPYESFLQKSNSRSKIISLINPSVALRN